MEVVPLSALSQAALMRVICSWKVTLSDGGRASQCAVPGCSDEGHLFLEGGIVRWRSCLSVRCPRLL